MRPEGPHPWFPAAAAALLFAASCVLGGLLFGARGALAGGVAGVAGAAALHSMLTRPRRRRLRALAVPFPDHGRRLLARTYGHYQRLPSDLRGRFEDDLRMFLADARITGVGLDVDEDLRLLVAASAVTLSVGWPDFEWDQLSEVLVYRQDFGRDYSFEMKELSGQAHPWGTVILSAPSLRASFAHPDDGYHVGLHEFAHLLDMEQGSFDGVPRGLSGRLLGEWLELIEHEMERLQRGKSSIDDYGADDPAEFLAVAVEAFFELPLELRRRHRELYSFLAQYFRQDPATWEEALGSAVDGPQPRG